MSRLAPLLDEYELSHRHPVNVAIHWLAAPLAILALMALAASVPLPVFGSLLLPFLALLLTYFARLSLRVTLAFLPVVAAFCVILVWLDAFAPGTWRWALPLFAICWVTLLLGHRIEGRVPSVFQNPHLIFVGPAWLMRRLFRRLNWPDP